jgi:DNA-binding transcriptional regulator GbsR (MarR family)
MDFCTCHKYSHCHCNDEAVTQYAKEIVRQRENATVLFHKLYKLYLNKYQALQVSDTFRIIPYPTKLM